MYACMLSCFHCVWFFVTLWTIACQAPLSMGFSQQGYWSGLTFPPPGDLPDSGIEPSSPCLYFADGVFTAELPGKPTMLTLNGTSSLRGSILHITCEMPWMCSEPKSGMGVTWWWVVLVVARVKPHGSTSIATFHWTQNRVDTEKKQSPRPKSVLRKTNWTRIPRELRELIKSVSSNWYKM